VRSGHNLSLIIIIINIVTLIVVIMDTYIIIDIARKNVFSHQ